MGVRAAARGFWRWYQRHYLAVLVITTAVFLLQLYHLYWLFTDVVLERLTGTSYYAFSRAGIFVSLFADYLEIPTLISASLLYVNELRRRFSWRDAGFLLLLNSQWIHILWITDEVVVETLTQTTLLQWHAAVAWAAILIDFLELPVIVDTLRRVWRERHEIAARIATRLFRRPAPRPAPVGFAGAPAPRATPAAPPPSRAPRAAAMPQPAPAECAPGIGSHHGHGL